MDGKDRQIIRALQKNARMTNQDLAAAVNLSPSPCLRRLRNLEDRGVILGYSVDVDAKAYGLPMTVFIRIRLERHSGGHIQEFESRIRAIDEVLECHLMTGPADYLLRVMVPDLDAYGMQPPAKVVAEVTGADEGDAGEGHFCCVNV